MTVEDMPPFIYGIYLTEGKIRRSGGFATVRLRAEIARDIH